MHAMKRALYAAAVGAIVMYVLDPARGRRRRALAHDQVDLRHRARGVVADLRSRLGSARDVSDDVLCARVRERLGAVVPYASVIDTTAEEGRVTLSGPVLARDLDRLLRRVRAVRGVRELESRLQSHAEPGDVPALQRAARVPTGGEVFELMLTDWSPWARLLAGLGGAALVLFGWRRGGWLGAPAVLGGGAMIARSLGKGSRGRLAAAEALRHSG